MKSLLTATTLVLSIAAISVNASAALITTNGVPDGSGSFYFYDSNLDSGAAGFGVLSHDPKDGWSYYHLQTYISSDNPFISSSMIGAHSYEFYKIVDRFGMTDSNSSWGWKVQNENGHAMSGTVSTDVDAHAGWGNPLIWGTILGQDGDYYNFSIPRDYPPGYTSGDRDEYGRYYSDSYELYGQFYQTYFPENGYGIFDFQNSFVYYSDGSRKSLSQAIFGDGSREVKFDFSNGNLDLYWREGYWSDGPALGSLEIIGISLAYNVPEPETWAMLLAGLAIVGAVTHRRRIKAVT